MSSVCCCLFLCYLISFVSFFSSLLPLVYCLSAFNHAWPLPLSRSLYFHLLSSSLSPSFSYCTIITPLDIAQLMKTWTTVTGYPYLKVTEEKWSSDSVTITLEQNRFLSDGSVDEASSSTLWSIPLLFASEGNVSDEAVIMDKKVQTFTIPISSSSSTKVFGCLLFVYVTSFPVSVSSYSRLVFVFVSLCLFPSLFLSFLSFDCFLISLLFSSLLFSSLLFSSLLFSSLLFSSLLLPYSHGLKSMLDKKH
jgi:hypothetical protein